MVLWMLVHLSMGERLVMIMRRKFAKKICIFAWVFVFGFWTFGLEDKNIKYCMRAHKLFRGTGYLVGRIDVPDIP